MVTMKSSRGLPSALAEERFHDAIEPIGHGQNLQFALFQPAQVGRRVEDRRQLVGIAFVQAVEVVVDHGLDGGSVMTHGLLSR